MARDDVYRLSTCLSLPTIPAISKYLTKADRIMTVWMLSCLRGLSWGSSRCLSARASSSLSLTSLDFCQWGRPVSTQIPISATSLAETCRGLAALHGVFICLQLTPLLLAWHLESILQTQGGERYQSCPTPWQTFYSDLDARFSAANKSRINCTQSPISQNLRLKKRWKLFTKMASCERNVAWMSASSRHGLVLRPHGPCLSTAHRLSSSTPCGSRESSSCRPSSSIKLCPSFIHGTLPVFMYCMSSVLVHHKGFLWLEHGPCDQRWTSLGAWWEVMDRWCCIGQHVQFSLHLMSIFH